MKDKNVNDGSIGHFTALNAAVAIRYKTSRGQGWTYTRLPIIPPADWSVPPEVVEYLFTVPYLGQVPVAARYKSQATDTWHYTENVSHPMLQSCASFDVLYSYPSDEDSAQMANFEALENEWPIPPAPDNYFKHLQLTPTFDAVAKPEHYASGSIECIDAMEAMVSPDEFMAHLRLTAIKYQWRYDKKGTPKQDIAKALWYLNRLAATLDKQDTNKES